MILQEASKEGQREVEDKEEQDQKESADTRPKKKRRRRRRSICDQDTRGGKKAKEEK